ncbi:uncharacterized protein Eint_090370 [Encephalitozoon intestinalis ATCC 50506]|uniref:Uncharacterized protein n=1 Tax=Encephalitozoon intestinalis (strain ATCC 50506) TaxID=876142 RepID=E0S9A3_ENCIT|nr:uncharacterized protein Eint_090370 [Encephalitozoon intestinalis ATCC 50506]ADM12167.1 hypothetical protein Eint_090370 [Encephalitozoon intestinalis ATCC 50506]UTX45969.1 hypothetical protein GPK93_09g15540 [Encephalitozoon intestinalis]
MGYRNNILTVCKKIKVDGGKQAPAKILDLQNVSDIAALINLSTEERRMKLISKYVSILSEFILNKAKEISGKRQKQEVSADDIKKVIVSEGLFFLYDIISLNKQ